MKLRFLGSALFNEGVIVLGIAAVGTGYVILGYYSNSLTGYVVAGIIAVVGLVAMALKTYSVYCDLVEQRRRAHADLVEEERIYKIAKIDFDVFPESWKLAFKELVDRGSSSGPRETVQFRDSGYVYLDGQSGRFYLLPHFAKSIKRLVKEWQAKTEKGTA